MPVSGLTEIVQEQARPRSANVETVGESVYHVTKVSLGVKRKYRVSDDDAGRPGALLGYAEKQLKIADEILIFSDESCDQLLATVRESSGFLAALTGFEVFDVDEKRLGSFRVLVRRSLGRTTWELEQPSLGCLIGSERSTRTALARRLIGLGGAAGEIANALMKYHFDFEQDGVRYLSIEKPKIFQDWYRVVAYSAQVDRTLLFALAVTMEAKQRG